MGNTATTADTSRSAEAASPEDEQREGLGINLPKFCGHGVLRIVYVVLSALTILLSIAMIAVSITTAIKLKLFTTDQSGRLVAMIILAVVSAAVLSICIYALIAVLKKHNKPVHAASITLIVLAIIQAIVVGVSVPVTLEDEQHLSVSLRESFRQAIVDPNKAKTWANIQSSLSCCGVNSAVDYKLPAQLNYYFIYVPISCCPIYDPHRSEIVQEKEKQACREKKEYYTRGCADPVLETYRHTAHVVLGVTVLYIVFMVIQSIVGAIITKKQNNKPQPDKVVTPEPVVPPKQPAVPPKQDKKELKAKLSIT